MRVVIIRAYAYGEPDGVYFEEIAIREKTFNELEEEIASLNFEVIIDRLSGGHTVSNVTIEIRIFENDDDLINYGFIEGDAGSLYYELEKKFKEYGKSLSNEIGLVRDYISTFDKLTTIEITVRESQRESVEKFIKDQTNIF